MFTAAVEVNTAAEPRFGPSLAACGSQLYRSRFARRRASSRRSALVLDRSPATTYEFKVTVRDFFGNTNQSNVVTVTTPAATDC